MKYAENFISFKDFFYSKTENNKLIQNIVFEYLDDNLENMICSYAKNKKNFTEFQIKVFFQNKNILSSME